MLFEDTAYLIPLVLAFIALGLLGQRRRQYMLVSSAGNFRRAPVALRALIRLPFVCWLLVSFLLIAALANPRSSSRTSYVTLMTKEAMVSVDTSHSMGYGKKHSTMASVRRMLHEFGQKRMKQGDRLGISAYGGHTSSYTRGSGYARVIQYPTGDPEVLSASIDALSTRMFGSYSAVGDGILASINALIGPQAVEAMGSYDPYSIGDNLWSMGTPDEDLRHIQKTLRAIGNQRGRYIVLFTDGKYNTGLQPARALWLAESMGLRVHFVAFESTAGTGLGPQEQQRHKEELIEAVTRTGGLYRESSDLEGLEMLFDEIDRAEKVEITLSEELEMVSRRNVFLYMAAIVYTLWLVSWATWGEPV
jgi:hypothetical protein